MHIFRPENYQRSIKVVEDLKVIARQVDRSIAHFALRWCLTNPVVHTALVGFGPPRS